MSVLTAHRRFANLTKTITGVAPLQRGFKHNRLVIAYLQTSQEYLILFGRRYSIGITEQDAVAVASSLATG